MSQHIQPISALTGRGTQALIQELGVIDTLRFLQQFRTGSGNYTMDRQTFVTDETVQSIVSGIKARRSDAA